MSSIAKVVETFNDGQWVTLLLYNEITKMGFYYTFATSDLVYKWSEILKAYTPLVSALHTYSQGKRSLVVYYNELLNGIVTFDYYDYSVRLVHNSKSLLSNVMVSTYSDSANYFELKTQSAQGNTLSFQLSVDEQTELTVTSKRDFVPLKDLTKVVDSIFSDISQYMDESLTLT